jgi:hypothetical protein
MLQRIYDWLYSWKSITVFYTETKIRRNELIRTSWLYSTPDRYVGSCMQAAGYTPLAVVSRARKTLRVSTTAGIAQILAVSSKEGAVIGAVLSTREFHRGHH